MISAIVVSHGHRDELAESLPALAPQVDEIVLIANIPGSAARRRVRRAGDRESGCRSATRPTSTAGSPRRRASSSSSTTPTPCLRRARSRSLRRVRGRAPARAASPARASRTPTAHGSRRAAASRPSAARSSAARRCAAAFPPLERQRAHYNLDERPNEPVEADWMLGGSLILRRAMLDETRRLRRRLPDVRRGDRPLLPRRQGGLGALVRPGRGRHPPLGRADRPAPSGRAGRSGTGARSLRYVRKHPESLVSR